MAKARTVVGLDVHAAKIVAAVLDVETGELERFGLKGDAVANTSTRSKDSSSSVTRRSCSALVSSSVGGIDAECLAVALPIGWAPRF